MGNKRSVTVVDYNTEWNKSYELENENIEQVLRKEIINIHHIGSTSVEGLSAKPIIDILVEVHDINRIDGYNQALEKIGYIAEGEYGIKGRRYFWKYPDCRTHHLHIFGKNDQNIVRHLAFRDYLRAFPEKAKGYGNFKKQLSKKYPMDIDSYMKEKDFFCRKIEEEALQWRGIVILE